MRIYIGNLAQETEEAELRQIFEQFGQVDVVSIILDKIGGTSKGFGFVEMPSPDQARVAILNLHGTFMDGQTLAVNEAYSRPNELQLSTDLATHPSRGHKTWPVVNGYRQVKQTRAIRKG